MCLESSCKFGIVIVPFIRNIFSLVPLDFTQWIFIAGVTFAPIAIMEVQKKVNELVFGRAVYKYKENIL